MDGVRGSKSAMIAIVPAPGIWAALVFEADRLAEHGCGMVQIRKPGGQRRLGEVAGQGEAG
jgi:hypothetical protein